MSCEQKWIVIRQKYFIKRRCNYFNKNEGLQGSTWWSECSSRDEESRVRDLLVNGNIKGVWSYLECFRVFRSGKYHYDITYLNRLVTVNNLTHLRALVMIGIK